MAWSTSDIPQLSGRTAIVTGSASGIGRETARALAAKGARTILAVRNLEKGEAVAADIRRGAPDAQVLVRRLDLSSLEAVKAFADSFLQDEARLDLLINNAGIMLPPYGKTADGFELQMGTNHLGHFALTGRLMPKLAESPGARVVAVASMAHRQGDIDFGDLNWERRRYNAFKAYGDSKLANLLFVSALSRKLSEGDADVIAVAAHPGWTQTDLMRHSSAFEMFTPLVAQPTADGALPSLRAATDPGAKGGEYYGPSKLFEMRGPPVRVQPSPRANDAALAARLWEVSETLTGVAY
jgi:NAD(P)-dependent dehydrogenase (short-subunit alcohol dehydrogenase family)